MKNYYVSLVGFLIIFSFFLAGCDKSDAPAPTKTELITSSSWKFKSANAEGLGDVSGNVPVCFKDNAHVFISGGSGSITEGTDICSPSYAGPFTWSFQSGESQLFISTVLFTGGSQTFNLVSLTETELKISQQVSPPLSTPLMITFTFQH